MSSSTATVHVTQEFLFKIDACSADAFTVVSFSGVEGLSQLFSFQVVASSRKPVPLDSIVGSPAHLTLRRPGGLGPRFVHGLVSAIEQTDSGEESFFRVTVVPAISQLALRANCRIFQNKTIEEIIKDVFADAQITSDQFSFNLRGTYQPRAYCVQYRESDLAFVLRLADEYGLHFFFKHTDQKHEMVIADSSEAHAPIEAPAVVEFHPPTTRHAIGEYANRFSYLRRASAGAVTVRDFRFEKPRFEALGTAIGGGDARLEAYDYSGEYQPQDDANDRARIRLERMTASQQLGSGSSDCRRLVAGSVFTLSGHGRRDSNREYLLTRVSHEGSQPVEGMSGATTLYANTFECIPSDVPFQMRGAGKPEAPGPQTAVVVGPAKEEIYTDTHGRVKVKFHWDRTAPESDEKRSCWIRVSQAMAGSGFGAVFLPRVGQEVIVEFLEGDIDQPIVTGRVYNGVNRPHYDLPAEKTKSTILSTSSKGGEGFNELRFEDSKDHEQVFLHAQTEMDTFVKHDSKEWVGNDRHLVVKQDQRERVEQDLHVDVKRDEVCQIGRDLSLKVNGKESIEVGAASSLTVKGDVVEVFKGAQSDAVTGDYYAKGKSVVLEAGTGLTIQAAGAFITLDATGVTITGPIVKLNAGGSPLSGSAVAALAPVVPTAAALAEKAPV